MPVTFTNRHTLTLTLTENNQFFIQYMFWHGQNTCLCGDLLSLCLTPITLGHRSTVETVSIMEDCTASKQSNKTKCVFVIINVQKKSKTSTFLTFLCELFLNKPGEKTRVSRRVNFILNNRALDGRMNGRTDGRTDGWSQSLIVRCAFMFASTKVFFITSVARK